MNHTDHSGISDLPVDANHRLGVKGRFLSAMRTFTLRDFHLCFLAGFPSGLLTAVFQLNSDLNFDSDRLFFSRSRTALDLEFNPAVRSKLKCLFSFRLFHNSLHGTV